MTNREIDALIAERVFNWEWREREFNPRVFGDNPPTYHVWWDKAIDNVPALCLTEKTNYNTDYTPPFSTDISIAWQMEEKIKELDAKLDLAMRYADNLYRISGADEGDYLQECWFIMIHATPLQRCLAALKAVEVEVPLN